MSHRADRHLNHTNEAIDGTIDKAFTKGRRANDKAAKFIESPEERAEAWRTLKKSPLTYSFIFIQFLASSVPLALSASFVTLSATVGVVGAIVTILVSVATALALLTPVLVVTVPVATFTWLCVVSTLAALDWIYRNIYVNSSIQQNFVMIKNDIVHTTWEIEENAVNEYLAYKQRAIEGTQRAEQKANELYDEAGKEFEGLRRRAIDGANDVEGKAAALYDEAGREIEGIKRSAMDGVRYAEDEAANAYNGVKKNAREVEKRGEGVADELMKNDGIIDGIEAKGSRAAGKLEGKPLDAREKVKH